MRLSPKKELSRSPVEPGVRKKKYPHLSVYFESEEQRDAIVKAITKERKAEITEQGIKPQFSAVALRLLLNWKDRTTVLG